MIVPSTDPTEEVGARLVRLRRERGWTQQRLAAPRYTHAYVSSVEAGRRRPSAEALDYFAGRLGVSYEELAYGRPGGLAAELSAALGEARGALSTGAVESARARYGQVEEQARRFALPDIEAVARAGLAEVILHAGDPRSASVLFEEAEKLRGDAALPERVPHLARRAFCLFLLGELDDAVALLESAVAEADREGHSDPEVRVVLYASLVPPYVEMGSHARAGRVADMAVEHAASARASYWVAAAHLNAGRVYFERGNVEQAEVAINRAAELFHMLGLESEGGRCHSSLGFVLARSGRASDAVTELESARDIARRTGDRETVASATGELAEALYRLGRLAEADRRASEAADAASSFGALALMAQARRTQGLVARDRKGAAALPPANVTGPADAARERSAEPLLHESVRLFERAEAAYEVATTCRLLGDLLLSENRVEEAIQAYRHGLVSAERTD